ncbi:hypothetical protein HPO96_05690 [Kribbella sandramycini]|uniref:LppM domain-containing protein n=1 Tax=Kribbella sandramycini TaxID=60450 RepID=A0A7Y4KXB9_9ACTN|nr:hypothetical protein [Kribbella sandramycini]MBB6567667.1 hypothetical protein [Kribbella sandramycini]NOL39732.1 hypothetical protein [Kribbella sandramycini]
MKRLVAVLTAVLAVVALSGCFRYRVDGKIGANGLVSGSIVIGYPSDSVTKDPGLGVYTDLKKFMTKNAAAVSRGTASVQPMDEGAFRGFRITFAEVALTDFIQLMRHEAVGPGETGGVDYRLTRQGDEFVFDAKALAKADQPPLPPEIFERAELAVSLTFPGPVVASNGSVSGSTVTWRPTGGELPHLTATGKLAQPADGPVAGDSGSGGNDVLVAVLAGGAGVLILAGAGSWLALRRRAR